MITLEEFETLRFGDLIYITTHKTVQSFAIYIDGSFNCPDRCYCMNIESSISYTDIIYIVRRASDLCKGCLVYGTCYGKSLNQISMCHKLRGLPKL